MFIDTIVDDSANVWDLYVRVECMIGYVPGRVDYGLEKFRLVSLHYCYNGFADAAPQFNSIDPYWFEYRFIDEYFVVNQYESFKGILEPRYLDFSALLRSHVFHMVLSLAVKNIVCYINP